MKLSDMIVPGVLLALALLLMGGCPDLAPAPDTRPVQPAPEPCPDGKCPAPQPGPRPWPRQVRGGGLPAKTLTAPFAREAFGAKVAGPAADGAEVACDYPGARHRRNTASKGLGLCVFTSIHHAADWQDLPALLEMPRWMIEKGIPGGGYPSKVAQLIPRLCQERGMPVPDFIQVESNDLEVLKLACQTGRMPCVTYAKSPTGRYGGRGIAHMVNLVSADDRWFVVLDNNYPGEDAYEWMSPEEFLRTYSGGGTGWSVIFLEPGPPPPPFNGTPGPPAPRQAAPPEADRQDEGYEWRPHPRDAGWQSLYRGGEELGIYVEAWGTYHPRKPGSIDYGPPKDPPVGFPGYRTRGVEWGKIKKEPRYYHGEYEVTREDVVTALTATVPRDERLHRVTFVGPPDQRERFDRAWKSDTAIAGVRDAFVGRSYAPDHWHVKGYYAAGVTVTDAAGKELYYSPSLPDAAALAGALRRMRPDYRPGGGVLPGIPGVNATTLLLGGAAALIFYLLTRKGK